jgi:hypothetical protein
LLVSDDEWCDEQNQPDYGCHRDENDQRKIILKKPAHPHVPRTGRSPSGTHNSPITNALAAGLGECNANPDEEFLLHGAWPGQA